MTRREERSSSPFPSILRFGQTRSLLWRSLLDVPRTYTSLYICLPSDQVLTLLRLFLQLWAVAQERRSSPPSLSSRSHTSLELNLDSLHLLLRSQSPFLSPPTTLTPLPLGSSPSSPSKPLKPSCPSCHPSFTSSFEHQSKRPPYPPPQKRRLGPPLLKRWASLQTLRTARSS